MIDISQWRESIGLWNYCQATSGRPTSRCFVGGDRAGSDSESTNRKKKCRRSLVLSIIVFLLFVSILLSGYLNYEPHLKGLVVHCYWSKVQCTSTDTFDSSYLQSILLGSDIGSSDVFYSLVYLYMYLLLLSGDVELNPGPVSGNPKNILSAHSDKLVHAISGNLHSVTVALNAKGLIPQQTKEDMYVPGVTNDEKSSKLVNVIEQILKASLNSNQYLTEICQVLQNQQHYTLTDIATSMLGQTIPDDVQRYAHNMKQYYLATDWGWAPNDYFGRLTLVEKQDYSTQTESARYLLMGQVDKVVKLSGNKEISVEDILRPLDDSLPLRVVIDGPPGIGKTMLCHKLLKMWSNETLVPQQYDLVLYCPLRNSKLATLADLFKDETFKASAVDWFSDRDGERLLIIFDGWDELSEQLRQSSLVASIISKDLLHRSSVIASSRNYASSSLLKMDNLCRHVQIIGFSKEEISTVIIRTLQKDTILAQELIDKKREDDKNGKHFTTTQSSKDSQLAVHLIKDLSVQDDVRSLCYVPLVCSMVISVYCEEGGHLPTQLYEKFILKIIRRHVELKSRHDNDPHTSGSLSSLPSLQEMCQIAYINLSNKKMTFSSQQLQSLSKEHYFELMTSFIAQDEEKYQFLHLSIQEFLAAWWIAKHEEKTKEIVKDHFADDHFRKCISFVSEITGKFYFSEEIFKRALKEADSLQYSVSTAIVQGEARVGKTCLKSLILSLPYESVSTSCIEAPCIAYISRYGSDDGKSWTLVTDDEIDEKVIAQLQDFMIHGHVSNESDVNSTPINTENSHYGAHQDPNIKPDVNSFIKETGDLAEPDGHDGHDHGHDGHHGHEGHDGPHGHHGNEGHKALIESKTGEANDKTSITSVSGKKFNPLEYCRNKCNIEKIGLHRQWLYFFDSGGQIQFQKLLLAFMPCPSALILVVNLSKKLSEPSNREMELLGNEKVIVDIFSLKVQDILAQMVSAVASKAHQHKPAKSDSHIKYADEKLIVLTVGTHGDKLEDFIKEGREDIEKIEAKQKELRIMLNSVSNSCTYDTECPLYEIDGRKAGESGKLDGGTSASIEKVSRHLKKQAHKIDVPLRWHYFGVILRKKANESKGLLSRSECEFYGKMLEMEVEQVHSALQFFHELGMLFYYHESKAKDLVFVKLDCLIDIIRDLVITVSKSWKLSLRELNRDERDLRVNSNLSVEIFKSSDAFKAIAKQLFNDKDDICFEKLIALFQYLKIAAEVQEEGQFVMPALLPLHNFDTIELPFPCTKSSPLLFYFENAVPMGFFCAIIVHLLSESNPWKIFSEEGSFSNFCTLKQQIKKSNFLKIALVEKLNCIEIYCNKGQYPLEAKNAVSKAIDSVMEVLKLSEKPSPAFYCPCNKKGEHFAIVNEIDSDRSSIDCKLGGDPELSNDEYDDYFSWFFTQQDLKTSNYPDSTVVVKPNDSSTQCPKLNLLLDEKPRISDLQLCFKSSAIHFSTIGTALDVDVRELLSNSMTASNNLIVMLNGWIDKNNDVTWRKILQVCDEYPDELGKAKAEVEKFLSKKIACMSV